MGCFFLAWVVVGGDAFGEPGVIPEPGLLIGERRRGACGREYDHAVESGGGGLGGFTIVFETFSPLSLV